MFIKIGDVILNADRISRVGRDKAVRYREEEPERWLTRVYLAGDHSGDANQMMPVAYVFSGAEGDALWEWFCNCNRRIVIKVGSGS